MLINKNQIQLATKLLTTNHINIQFVNNRLIIKLNPSNIDITDLLTKNNITFKTI